MNINSEWKVLRQLILDKFNSQNAVTTVDVFEREKIYKQIKFELDLLIDDFISKSLCLDISSSGIDDIDSVSLKLDESQINSVSLTLDLLNVAIEEFVTFMKEFRDSKQLSRENLNDQHWMKFLFSNEDQYNIDGFVKNDFWKSLRNFNQLKEIIGLTSSPILNSYDEHIREGLEFRSYKNPKQWAISFNFFHSLSQSEFNLEQIIIATRLYLIHESVHFEHGLTSYSVRGIGNFPKTIEEADYQADTYAIITEFAYQFFSAKDRKEVDMQQLVLRLIEIAIGTTFSFVSKLSIPVKQEQIRRVNRTLIWAYQFCLIKFINEIDDRVKFQKIFKILAIKPIIELHGFKVLVSNDLERPRVFFDFQNFDGLLSIASFYNNEVHRHTFDAVVTKEMVSGLQNLEFHKICEAMSVFFTSVKISKNI